MVARPHRPHSPERGMDRRDKSAWPWDQALYGKFRRAVLYAVPFAGGVDPGHAARVRPPGSGNRVARAVLCARRASDRLDRFRTLDVNRLRPAAALLLMARAIWELSGGRFWIAVTGLVVMASAPLFIALSHYYLVEMLQTAAVCLVHLHHGSRPEMEPAAIGGQLALATACAMLAKVSSPLFCFGPGLVALYYLSGPATGRFGHPHTSGDDRWRSRSRSALRRWLVLPEHPGRGRPRVDGRVRTSGRTLRKIRALPAEPEHWLSAVHQNSSRL